MIFTPDHIALIQSGRKTQTRRAIKDGEGICRYEPGKAYAAQPGHGKPASLRITILNVRYERLGDISDKDAKREGYRSVYEFQQVWKDLHGVWTPELVVWVISFVAGDRTEMPRYLARSLGSSRGDYVDIPAYSVRDEGQALSEREQEQMSAEARMKPRVQQIDVWRDNRQEIISKLEALRALDIDRDVERQLRTLERQLAKIDQRLLRLA